jgi:hypothetical protein
MVRARMLALRDLYFARGYYRIEQARVHFISHAVLIVF